MKRVMVDEEFVQYKFCCPNCEWPHWLRRAQLLVPRYFIVCDCGCSFKPEPSEEIKSQQINKVINNLQKEAIDMLVLMGYSKIEATLRIKQIYRQNKSLEDIIVDAVKV